MAVIEAEMQPAEMMVQMGFDYSQVDEAYRDEVQAAELSIRQLSAGVVTGILAIGKRLIEVKGMLPHGQFTAWVENRLGTSERMAQNYMNVAREYGDGKNRNSVSAFSPSVLYVLASPSTPPEVREQVEVQFAETGKPPTRAEVKRLRDETRKPEPMPAKAVYVEPEPELVIEPIPLESRRLGMNGFGIEKVNGLYRYVWRRQDCDSIEYSATHEYLADAYDAAFARLKDAGLDDRFPPTEIDPEEAEPVMPADLAALGFYFRKANAMQWAIVHDDEPEPYESNWCYDPADCVEDVRDVLSSDRELVGDKWIANALVTSSPTNVDFMSAIRLATDKELNEAYASLSTEDKFRDAREAALKARLDELGASASVPTKEEFAAVEEAVERSITPEAAAAMRESAERSRRVREDVDLSPVAPLGAESLSQLHPNPVIAALIDPTTPLTTIDPGSLHWAVGEATATQLNEALVLMPDALRAGRGPVLESALKKRGGVKEMMAEKRRDAAIDPRLVKAKAMIAALVNVRQQVRDNYGDLTGRDTDTLAFERSVETMLKPLMSLVDILEKGDAE